MSRRERRGGEIVTIWWRDIPAQVNGQHGARREQNELPPRFRWAIERAAKRAGLTDVHEFTHQWRRTSEPCPDGVDIADAAQAVAVRLVADHPEDRLRHLVRTGGLGDGPELPPGRA